MNKLEFIYIILTLVIAVVYVYLICLIIKRPFTVNNLITRIRPPKGDPCTIYKCKTFEYGQHR